MLINKTKDNNLIKPFNWHSLLLELLCRALLRKPQRPRSQVWDRRGANLRVGGSWPQLVLSLHILRARYSAQSLFYKTRSQLTTDVCVTTEHKTSQPMSCCSSVSTLIIIPLFPFFLNYILFSKTKVTIFKHRIAGGTYYAVL